MTGARCLVLAKAPVAGRSKTRLGQTIGMGAAASVAAAALLDTLAACAQAFGTQHCVLALDGDLAEAVDGTDIARWIRSWTVIAQRGDGFAERIAHAHLEAGPGPVVQIGMDTPQVEPAHLLEVADALDAHDAVLGPAEDGGWWVLGLRDPSDAAMLVGVPMSTPHTFAHTWSAFEGGGLHVVTTRTLRDVDTASDASAVAGQVPAGSRFASAWLAVTGVPS